jgi:hypothetical protein
MKKPKKTKTIKPRNPLVPLMRLTRKPGPFKKREKYPDWKDWDREEKKSVSGLRFPLGDVSLHGPARQAVCASQEPMRAGPLLHRCASSLSTTKTFPFAPSSKCPKILPASLSDQA